MKKTILHNNGTSVFFDEDGTTIMKNGNALTFPTEIDINIHEIQVTITYYDETVHVIIENEAWLILTKQIQCLLPTTMVTK